ncbi:hypothetical protein JCM14124_21720 [Humidesulfovibrio idahonensis]
MPFEPPTAAAISDMDVPWYPLAAKSGPATARISVLRSRCVRDLAMDSSLPVVVVALRAIAGKRRN